MVCSYLALPPTPPLLIYYHLWITTSTTSFLITWRLDTSTPDIDYIVIFAPLFVDVVCGLFLLWFASPDRHVRMDTVFSHLPHARNKFKIQVVWNFYAWGVQGLFLALKLDKIISWPWLLVFSVWTILFLMMASTMFYISFKISARLYPKIWNSLNKLSFSKRLVMTVETTMLMLLIWSWVVIGCRTWIKILVRCLWLLYV